MGDKILVAGGAGFIGSALVRDLLAHDHHVVVLDDFSGGPAANLQEVEDRIEIIECDAADEDRLVAAMLRARPTHVVSCIGDTYVPAAYEFPERFFRNNVDAHLNLLKACRHSDIAKLLYLSSAEVYVSQSAPLHEESPLGVANTYAASKLAADQLMKTYAVEHDVPTVIARMFNCYGPRETHAYIVPELIDQFSRSATAVIGDPRPVRDLTFVGDTADALRRLLFTNTANGCFVNVGSGNPVAVGELAERIGRLMGHDVVSVETIADKLRRSEIDVIRCDNRKLRALTGWAPSVGLDDGLAATIAWFRDNDGWPWRTHAEETSMPAGVALLRQA